MRKLLLRLPENRVRRNYRGGAAIDMLRKKPNCTDCDMPEDWIASTVAAKNPGLTAVENEGLSTVTAGDSRVLLSELFGSKPELYLGRKHYERFGSNTGFLAKLLDSSIRLHVQVHPTREFAGKYLNSRWGKLECYYILGTRPGYDGYIRFGFQKAPSRDEWRHIIETQDIRAMDACFSRVPVKPGEVWFVPGGLPHAIGEGLLMIEVMEPTDFVVRCEFEREGIIVPPEARFMGRGLDFALDMFDYSGYSPEKIRSLYRVEPEITAKDGGFLLEKLICGDITDCFELNRLTLYDRTCIKNDGSFHVGIVCRGEPEIRCGDEILKLGTGDCYFAAAACGNIYFTNRFGEKAEICLVKAGMTCESPKSFRE